MVALVSGASESVYRGGCYSYVPRHIGLYRNDFGGKISQLGYSEPLMITLLTNFLTASSIVGALSIGLSIPDYGCTASALAYKIASLKHTDERQPPLLRVLL